MKSVGVSNRVYESLLKLKDEMGFTSLSDVIAFLLSFKPQGRQCELDYLKGKIAELEERVSRLESLYQQKALGEDGDDHATSNALDSSKRRIDLFAKERMTPRQRSYIKKLVEELCEKTGSSPEELREQVKKELGVEVSDEMSKDDASKVIEWLEERLGGES